MKTHCDYCHQPIAPEVHPFTLRLELFPAIEPSLEISEDDLNVDLKAEMLRVIKLMRAMDEGEAVKQEKLMFVAYSFTLCPACRHQLAGELERLNNPGK
jgi:hypothetical protein